MKMMSWSRYHGLSWSFRRKPHEASRCGVDVRIARLIRRYRRANPFHRFASRRQAFPIRNPGVRTGIRSGDTDVRCRSLN